MQCLLCTFHQSLKQTSRARRKFSTSPTQLERKRPKHASIKASAMQNAFNPASTQQKYDEEQLGKLEQRYTKEQLKVIKQSEKEISDEDLENPLLRPDPWSLNYFDDLSKVSPTMDKPIRAPHENIDPTHRLRDDEEVEEELARFIQNMPDDDPKKPQTETEIAKRLFGDMGRQVRLTVGKEAAERNPRSAEAPNIVPRQVSKPKGKTKAGNDSRRDEEEASPALVRLMQMTGYSRQEISRLRVKSIVSHRVVNQTRLGKISKQYFLSIAGNGQGLIGIGEGKSDEPTEARLQSQYRAIRNMQPILRYEGRTIFGDVSGKVSATELELYARPPGEKSTRTRGWHAC